MNHFRFHLRVNLIVLKSEQNCMLLPTICLLLTLREEKAIKNVLWVNWSHSKRIIKHVLSLKTSNIFSLCMKDKENKYWNFKRTEIIKLTWNTSITYYYGPAVLARIPWKMDASISLKSQPTSTRKNRIVPLAKSSMAKYKNIYFKMLRQFECFWRQK